MVRPDRATSFTMDYLRVLEERLGIEWSDAGDPICIPSRVNIFTLQRIRSELDDLFHGNDAEAALTDSRTFGQSDIQAVGFGLVENFDKFIKLGFLCGRRVVLWDFLHGRILSDPEDLNSKDLVIKVANELLLLKKVAASGGVTILPHPLDFSDKARRYVGELERSNRLNPANLGLVASLSVTEEIPLHPYTLFSGSSAEWPKHPEGLRFDSHFPEDEAALQRVASDLFADKNLAFLEGVRASDFYAIVNADQEFFSTFRNLIALPGDAKSQTKIREHIIRVGTQITEMMERRNRQLVNETLTKSGAGISLFSSAAALLHGAMTQTTAEPLLLLASTLALGGGLLGFLGHVLNQQERLVVAQAFHELKLATYENPA